MATILLTQSNIKTALANNPPGTYFVVESSIGLTSSLTFPENSVVDFQGGYFQGSAINRVYTIDLNGSTVVAPAYAIFRDGTSPKGFANSLVRAEWFKYSGIAEHVAINNALRAAAGCPVTLEARDYNLTGSITFPELNGKPQTLISPGDLYIPEEADFPAINLTTSYITLKINTIRRTIIYHNSEEKPSDSPNYPPFRYGTGVLFSGNCYHITLDVFAIMYVKYGISIVPDSTGLRPNAGTQYTTINFQKIIADYCFYIDLFSKSKSDTEQSNWCGEVTVTGGQLSGLKGIYFEDPVKQTNAYGSDRLRFFNVGFEGFRLDQCNPYYQNEVKVSDLIPMKLSRVHSSSFRDLRMAETLPTDDDPDAALIKLDNVSLVDISVKGWMLPKNIPITSPANNITVRAWFFNGNIWEAPYDTLYVKYLPVNGVEQPQKVITSSIGPCNISPVLLVDKRTPDSPPKKPNEINSIVPKSLPALFPEVSLPGNGGSFNILPHTCCLDIRSGYTLSLSLTGLRKFYPAFIDFYVNIQGTGLLQFSAGTEISYRPAPKLSSPNEPTNADGSISFRRTGLYRLMWTSDPYMNIVITYTSL